MMRRNHWLMIDLSPSLPQLLLAYLFSLYIHLRLAILSTLMSVFYFSRQNLPQTHLLLLSLLPVRLSIRLEGQVTNEFLLNDSVTAFLPYLLFRRSSHQSEKADG